MLHIPNKHRSNLTKVNQFDKRWILIHMAWLEKSNANYIATELKYLQTKLHKSKISFICKIRDMSEIKLYRINTASFVDFFILIKICIETLVLLNFIFLLCQWHHTLFKNSSFMSEISDTSINHQSYMHTLLKKWFDQRGVI